jgi:NTE family protein
VVRRDRGDRVARRLCDRDSPVNPPITEANPQSGYRFEVRQAEHKNKDNLVVLAFSGGGTRAAAFSYGVLEFLATRR